MAAPRPGATPLILALGCVLGTGCSCRKEADRTEAPAVVPPTASRSMEAAAVPTPDRAGQPTTGTGALGINEGVSVPQALTRRLSDAQQTRMLEADASQLAALPVGIVRANTATTPWLSWWSWQRAAEGGDPWARPDSWVRTVQAAGLDPLVMLGPWPGNRTAGYTDRYVPEDMAAYTAWVTAVVERYDGDGVDDMPGLVRPVRHWEVDNEPDLHNSVPPKGKQSTVDPADFQTPAQYAQVLVATAAAIRSAQPDAVVLSAGLYRPHTAPGRAWLEELLAEPGAREAFDVLSLHCYFDQDELGAVERTLAAWRDLAPEKGLWITETSVPSAPGRQAHRQRHIDEDWQAGMVAAVYGAFLAGGAERVFWHTLADPPEGNRDAKQSPFAHHSLFRAVQGSDRLEEKPAAAVFERMAAVLGPADPASFAALDLGDGQLLQTDRGWLAYWGTPRVPAGATRTVDLRTGVETPVDPDRTHVVAAPAWIPRPDRSGG